MRVMPRRTTTDATGDTSSQIRAVALELFAEQGFDGTALQQIADRLGFTKAALYYHFRSKDELLSAVVEPFFTDVEPVMDASEAAAERKAPTRRKRLDDFVDCLLTHRNVLGFLSRDLAAVSRPDVAKRSLALQERLSAAIGGSDLSHENRIRVSFAISGIHGAIVNNSEATADELRGPVLDSVDVILRAVSRSIAASNK